MTIELKPCPFCGDRARLFVEQGVYVVCTGCGCRTHEYADDYSIFYGYDRPEPSAIEKAVNDWNNRDCESVPSEQERWLNGE